ncbi:hypothetical protein COLO4_16369 [Corchorus olitorius]|uniref:Aminotransferase-like plant mobile domain-containing protein n=1 Tax=Corchorus olitorius TaxID=93759 RepID=A0A1R3JHX1_9ROSI|nr:hypothetical protein COLO4_16369 [Corchorus olitorius]
MRRSTRKSSVGVGLGAEERLNSNQMLSKNLLVELMERWNSEEQGFMLLPSVVKVTLMDVALILGIRVVGDPILLREDEPFLDLESEYGAAVWKRKITVASLESRLDSLGEVVDEDFVRTFILFMFGTLLFPDASGKVDTRYLAFLKSLDDIGRFAWGAAVLDNIFMWLNKRKESNVQYIGGCLILLQIWSYEHIDLARPELIDSYLMFPRARRWENSRSHQRQYFTAKFRELQNHQITWQLQPTSDELEFDFINELLEVESSTIDNSSDGGSVIGVELQLESDLTNNSKLLVEKGEGIHLKQSTASQDIADAPIMATEFPSTSCSSKLDKEIVELSSQCQNTEKKTSGNVVGLHLESDTTDTRKIQAQKGQEANLKQLTKSQQIPEMQTEAMAYPTCNSESKECREPSSSNCNDSEKVTSSNEDELIQRNQILEVENLELRKEIEALKVENRRLKMHIGSSNDLVTRLERLLMDESET